MRSSESHKKELCLGAAAVESRVSASKKHLDDAEELATTGTTRRLVGIVAVALAVVGCGLAFWRTRSSPA